MDELELESYRWMFEDRIGVHRIFVGLVRASFVREFLRLSLEDRLFVEKYPRVYDTQCSALFDENLFLFGHSILGESF